MLEGKIFIGEVASAFALVKTESYVQRIPVRTVSSVRIVYQ